MAYSKHILMNNNTIYKDSQLGKIPSDWEVKRLGEIIVNSYSGGTPARNIKEYYENGTIPWIKSGEINQIYVNETEECITEEALNNSSAKITPKGTLLYALYGATAGIVGFTNIDAALNQAILAIFPNEKKLLKRYLFFYLGFNKDNILKEFTQGGQPNLSAGLVKGLKFPLPPLPEQTRIAEVLSAWDKAIINVQAAIEQVELRNKWLMQELLSGKRRLKGFGDNKWKIKLLKEILIPVRKSLIPQKNELYQQIGIRSHTKGIFYKDKVSGATLGDKRVFWIEPSCFIVNIVFAWEHAIAKTTENEIGMIASHRFPMFKTKDKVLDLDYLLYLFKSPHGKYLLGLASPGGAGRNKTLGQSEFMKLQILVPSLGEQMAIAKVLEVADKEIQLLKNKLEKLKEQKKGLMQVLLTGKKRLTIN